MDYLKKVSREALEDMVRTILDDLESEHPDLYQKYKDEADDYIYCIDLDEATEIVHKMKPFSEKFTYPVIEQYFNDKGLDLDEEDYIEYYLVMNMFYNDFKKVFDKFPTMNQTETYYEFSRAFIDDEDAPSHKVGKYFKM